MLKGGAIANGNQGLKVEVKRKKSSSPKWLPYVLVGGICIVALLAVLISANSGTGGGSAGGVVNGGSNDLIPVDQATDDEEAKEEEEEKKKKEEEASMLEGAYPPRLTSADASSQLPDEYYEGDGYFSYGPELVLDDNTQTAWNEGVDGNGVGQWIRVSASSPQLVYGVSIRNGYPRKEQTFYNNHRIKDCTIELSDGYKLSYTLQDTYNQWQDIAFDQGHDTLWIKITINSAYNGGKHDDTCLSGVRAY